MSFNHIFDTRTDAVKGAALPASGAAERETYVNLYWLLGGSKGGPTRLKILIEIKRSPMNPNQISRRLGLGYKTTMYHLNILEKSGLIKRLNNKYGAPYYTTELVDSNWAKIIKLASKLGIDVEWD